MTSLGHTDTKARKTVVYHHGKTYEHKQKLLAKANAHHDEAVIRLELLRRLYKHIEGVHQ